MTSYSLLERSRPSHFRKWYVWSVCGRFVSRWRHSMCACIEKMFFRRKDNTDVGGKIPEICMSGELTQGFCVGYHKCLPSADTSVGELSGQTARASLSARLPTNSCLLARRIAMGGKR
jgi:hypothetical protein